MQIVYADNANPGVPLTEVPFGTVVRRFCNDVCYLVVSPMDGTGRRCLVPLQSGTLKDVPQDTRVILLEATLTVWSVQ